MNTFSKHFLSTTGTRIIIMSLGFLQGIIIARFLLPEGRGYIAAYLAVITLIMPISELGIKQASSFFLKKENYNLEKILNYQVIILIMSSIITFIFLIVTYYIQNLTSLISIFFILLSIPLRIHISYLSGIVISERKINVINIVQLLLILSDLIFVILFFVFLELTVDKYFIIYFISSLISYIYISRWIKKNYKYKLELFKNCKNIFVIIKKGIKYALPLFVMGVNYSIDILILNHYVTISMVGIYALGVSLALLLWQIPSILNLLIFSYSVSTDNPKEFSRNLWSKTKIGMLIMIPITLLIIIASKYIIPLVYGSNFSDSYEVLLFLMPGVYFMIAFKLLNGDLAARGYPMIAFYIFSFGAIINVLLNIILIKTYGINGAAIASTISYSISSILFIYFYYKKTIKNTKEDN